MYLCGNCVENFTVAVRCHRRRGTDAAQLNNVRVVISFGITVNIVVTMIYDTLHFTWKIFCSTHRDSVHTIIHSIYVPPIAVFMYWSLSPATKDGCAHCSIVLPWLIVSWALNLIWSRTMKEIARRPLSVLFVTLSFSALFEWKINAYLYITMHIPIICPYKFVMHANDMLYSPSLSSLRSLSAKQQATAAATATVADNKLPPIKYNVLYKIETACHRKIGLKFRRRMNNRNHLRFSENSPDLMLRACEGARCHGLWQFSDQQNCLGRPKKKIGNE